VVAATSPGYVKFDTTASKVVTMRIATSLISVAQAKHNLDLEISASDTFDSVKARAQALWDKVLGVITVEGANDDALTTLYSQPVPLNLYPNSAYENTGTAAAPVWKHVVQSTDSSDPAPPGTNHDPDRGARRRRQGLRQQRVLGHLSHRVAGRFPPLPVATSEMINGFVQQYKDGGWISRWSSPGYANIMTGTSSDVAFADGVHQGRAGHSTSRRCTTPR